MGTRRTGNGVERVYEAAEAWVDCALRNSGSLFTPGEEIWSTDWLRELYERFLNHPDDSSNTFLYKLEHQLSSSPPQVYQLMGEALYFYFLIVHTKSSTGEQQVINTVLRWSPSPVAIPQQLVDGLTPGLVNPGQYFHNGRPFQVGFLIELLQQWKTLGSSEQDRLLDNPWEFKKFVGELNSRSELLRGQGNRPSTQREALFHLVFPDTFEAITSVQHKKLIAKAFSGYVKQKTNDVDRDLLEIRPRLEAEHGVGIHLYEGPIRSQWAPNSELDARNLPIAEDSQSEELALASYLDTLANHLSIPVAFLRGIEQLLGEKPQIIFQGPPGTGKTYIARALAKHLAGSEDRVTLVQFHPSYAYEDFVQGFRPAESDDGQLRFALTDGPLVRAAKAAEADSEAKHFLIIDEINRGNLGKILGELYFLLEYRDEAVHLQYQKEGDKPFSLPKNLYIIGTMNTADRSIALVDLALRRRFNFVEFSPSKPPVNGVLRHWLAKNAPSIRWVVGVVDLANEKLNDRDAAIGPSYFMKDVLNTDAVERIWEHSVRPYIEERLFADQERLAEFDLDALRKAVDMRGEIEDAIVDIVKSWLGELGADSNTVELGDLVDHARHRNMKWITFANADGIRSPVCAIRVDENGKNAHILAYERNNVNFVATPVEGLTSVDDIDSYKERIMDYARRVMNGEFEKIPAGDD